MKKYLLPILAIAAVIMFAFANASCSRCEYLYTECYERYDRFGYYEVCEDVYDCRTVYGDRIYATADAQAQYDLSIE